jgi:plastocyanin
VRRARALLLLHGVLAASCAAQAETLNALVRDGDGKPLPNAVVVAVPADGRLPPARPALEVVDQVDKEFMPYVKPVRVGSSVKFPNKDNVQHHVYSFSTARKFELPLYRGTPAQPVLFDKTGVVKIGCNIHDWMVGYVYVAESPYFAKTLKEGSVDLKLPPGRYRMRVWHPRMRDAESATVKDVEVPAGAPARTEWRLRLDPEFRPPRVSLPGDSGYR